jgi:hypothetical protein
MKSILAASLAFTVIALPALADEVWSTPVGDVIYEDDLPTGEAVLSFPTGDPEIRSLAYFGGLAGVATGRTYFEGVWIEPDAANACPVSIADPESGKPRNNWGRIQIVFTEPDFPGGWVAMRGTCFGTPDQFLVGKPVAGQ